MFATLTRIAQAPTTRAARLGTCNHSSLSLDDAL